MNGEQPAPPVERLFPLVLRSRLLLVGRENIRRSKSRLHFVLITRDISENSREEMLKTFKHYPVVQHYTAADLEEHFALKGTKVIGFKKSALDWKALPGGTALPRRGPGGTFRPQGHQGDRLKKIRPGPIPLRRTQAP